MRIKVVLALIFIKISVPFFMAYPVWGSAEAVKHWYLFLLRKSPPYVMNVKIRPDDPIELGVDCSRLHYLAYRWSGKPVKRTTSFNMAMGYGGWEGKTKDLDNANELDIVWWTWRNKPHRPLGHTGVLMISPDSGLLEVVHASQSRGKTVIEPLRNKLLEDLKLIKRMDCLEK